MTLRVDGYRAVFTVEGKEITILGIRYRRDVYEVVGDGRVEKESQSNLVFTHEMQSFRQS